MFEWNTPHLKDILTNNKILLPKQPDSRQLDPEVLRVVVDAADRFLMDEWHHTTASDYKDYFVSGSRKAFCDKFNANKGALFYFVAAEWMTRQGRYLQKIMDYAWAFTEMATWVIPAHLFGAHLYEEGQDVLPSVCERTFVDLLSAEVGGLLSWVHSLFGEELDRVSPAICERIRFTLRERVLQPFLSSDDFWWMGFVKTHHPMNNWNPWIVSNLLLVLANAETDPDAYCRGVRKCLACLRNYIDKGTYEDGGCDEGPAYWSAAAASLFDCLEILYTLSGGQINLFGEPLIQKMGSYLWKVHIGGFLYTNFADSTQHVRHQPALLYRYARASGDSGLLGLAYEELEEFRPKTGFESMSNMTYRCLKNCLTIAEMKQKRERFDPPQLELTSVLPRLQIMTARERPDKTGLFLACKGGDNAESHNHNDVGSFIVYLDQKPLFMDAGSGEYTIKTFGPDRYTLWNMTSSYHNCPEYNGTAQQNGREFAASEVVFQVSEQRAQMRMELKNAYPSEAGILSAVRTLTMERGARTVIRLRDEFELNTATDRIAFHFLTPWAPVFEGNGMLLDIGAENQVKCGFSSGYRAEIDKIPLDDSKLREDWGTDQLYRIRIQAVQAMRMGSFQFEIQSLYHSNRNVSS